MNTLYEDDYYLVRQHNTFHNIPGFYVITRKSDDLDNNIEAIYRLAELEKMIRDFLLSKNVELIGIYREQSEKGFQIFIIPYHIEILKKLDISPDLYQPFIEKYLSSFGDKYLDEAETYNKEFKKMIKSRW